MKWFVERNGKQLGPFSSGQLKQLAASGQIALIDLVRREDQQRAVAAEKIKGLFSESTSSATTDSPGMSTKNHSATASSDSPQNGTEKPTSATTTTSDANVPFQFFCPNGHLLEGTRSQQGQQSQCPQCGLCFLIPSAPVSETPFSPGCASSSTTGVGCSSVSQSNTPMWYVLQNNVQYGPFDFAQLRKMAMTGRFYAHDYVRASHDHEWHGAASCPGLVFAAAAPYQTQTGVNLFAIQRLLSIGGGLVIFIFSITMWLQLSGGSNSSKVLRDFGDNTANYRGKTLTFKLAYDGPPLNPLLKNGAAPIQLDPSFRASGLIGSNFFHYDLTLTIPEGTPMPSLNSLDDVVVTFECTLGDLRAGNIVKKIARP